MSCHLFESSSPNELGFPVVSNFFLNRSPLVFREGRLGSRDDLVGVVKEKGEDLGGGVGLLLESEDFCSEESVGKVMGARSGAPESENCSSSFVERRVYRCCGSGEVFSEEKATSRKGPLGRVGRDLFEVEQAAQYENLSFLEG